MTNKEFQNLLSQYPDDYNISVNWAFGWEVPSNKYKEDPYIYVNDDCGFIEIEPKEYRDIWIKCSERLPEFINGEENQYYYDTKLQKILTCKWEVSDRVLVMCSNGEIHISVFQHNLRMDGDAVIQNESFWNDKIEVIAWMPMPKFEEE